MGDSDPLNKISGSTGISGATDAVFILDKSRRSADTATLCCTGRDIPYREMELRLGKEIHTWKAVSDSLDTPELLLPDVIGKLLSFMREQKHFAGSNAEFTSIFCSSADLDISAKALKQQMNRYRFQMEERFVFFRSHRSNGQRLIEIHYLPPSDESDESAVQNSVAVFCVPSVPCVPEV